VLYVIVLITDEINYGKPLVCGSATGWTILWGQVGATSGRGKRFAFFSSRQVQTGSVANWLVLNVYRWYFPRK